MNFRLQPGRSLRCARLPGWLCTGMVLLSGAVLASGAVAEPELPAAFVDADFPAINEHELRLGQLLFYDPILSGNRNISCASCHHPDLATGDGLSLGIGEGGVGLGLQRRVEPTNPPEQRIPRNSPPLFNLGARQIHTLFHDGRIQSDEALPGGFRTPLSGDMESGFSGLLSAQTMFPVLSPDEMAGHYQENDIARRVRLGMISGPDGAWAAIAARVSGIEEYRLHFARAYPDIRDGKAIAFTDISNAIAAFIAFEWRSDRSAFDAVLRQEAGLSDQAHRGMQLFYGAAGCARCHSGTLLSDQQFHAMGQPQLGPGKAERFEDHQEDTGRYRVTGDPADAYAFRTPALRNVMHTGPWGHAGAYDDLQDFLEAHLAPDQAIPDYQRTVQLPPLDNIKSDWAILDSARMTARIIAAASQPVVVLDETDMSALLAFLDSLTDPASLQGRLGIPSQVPSGLPLDQRLEQAFNER